MSAGGTESTTQIKSLTVNTHRNSSIKVNHLKQTDLFVGVRQAAWIYMNMFFFFTQTFLHYFDYLTCDRLYEAENSTTF